VASLVLLLNEVLISQGEDFWMCKHDASGSLTICLGYATL